MEEIVIIGNITVNEVRFPAKIEQIKNGCTSETMKTTIGENGNNFGEVWGYTDSLW